MSYDVEISDQESNSLRKFFGDQTLTRTFLSALKTVTSVKTSKRARCTRIHKASPF